MKRVKSLSIVLEWADLIQVSRTELEQIKTELKLISQGGCSKEEVYQTLDEWTASRCHKLILYQEQQIIQGKLDKDWMVSEHAPPLLGLRMDMCSQS